MTGPADPALVLQGLAPRLYDRLGAVVQALVARGEATLPDADDHTPLLARAVYRWWLDGRPWAPFVRGSLPPPTAPALWWGPAGAAAPAGVDLFTVDPRDALSLDPRELEVLARLDAGHLAATDPSLARARAQILPRVRFGDVVYVQGPPGSGRGSLGAWAVELGLLLGAAERARDGSGGTLPPRMGGAVIRDLEEGSAAARETVASAVLLRMDVGGVPPGRRSPRPDEAALDGLVGSDPAFCRCLDVLVRHAPGTSPVLLLGESGVGKELFAKALHELSGRRGQLKTLDLASRADTLREDDLFGHASGAYTGAGASRRGMIREADGGTLFLDEVGNLSWESQGRLLRVLETSEVLPLGSDRPVKVDVRVVAAANVDLEALVAAGRFRVDLYHRLKGVVLRIPPLRARQGDIPELARHFLPRGGTLAKAAEAALVAWPWPGNVRELRNVIRAASESTRGRALGVEDLGVVGLRPPLVVTAQVDPDRLGPPISRAVASQLGGLPVRLDPPAERGRGCLLNAIRHGLDGRGIEPEALEMLLGAPWWGNLGQLHAGLGALLRLAREVVTVADVRLVVPEATAGRGRVPIITLFGPSLRSDGSVGGLADEHHEGALLIGRADSRVDLAGDDPRSVERRRWLDAQLQGAIPAYVPFRHLAWLSRAQLLVTRGKDGLEARLFPRVGVETLAGPLGGPLQLLEDGRSVRLGAEGEIQVRRGNERYLELFVFLGEQARLEAEPLLAERLGVGAPPTVVDEGARRARVLDAEERGVLVPIVVEVEELGFEFGPHVIRSLKASTRSCAPALLALLAGQKVSQAAGRLYQLEGNAALCRETAEALQARGLWPISDKRLPKDVRDAVQRVTSD